MQSISLTARSSMVGCPRCIIMLLGIISRNFFLVLLLLHLYQFHIFGTHWRRISDLINIPLKKIRKSIAQLEQRKYPTSY